MNLNFLYKLFFILILIFFSINSNYSSKYLDSDLLFQAKINDIYKNENNEYFVDLYIENLDGYKISLDYNIEILYESANLVVSSKTISCSSNCKIDLQLNRVFFGNHNIVIRTKYNGKSYQKILNFDLELKNFNSNYKIIMDDTYYINDGQVEIFGKILTDSNQKQDYYFEIFPKSSPDLRQDFKITCQENCNFNFNLISPIIIDDYYINIYSKLGDFQNTVKIKYFKEDKNNKLKDLSIEKKLEILKTNKLSTKIENYTIIKDIDLENFIGVQRLAQTKIPQKKSLFSSFFSNTNNQQNKLEIVEIYLNGSSQNIEIEQNKLKDYKIKNDVVEIILPNNLNKRLSLNPTIKRLEEQNLNNKVIRDTKGISYSKLDLDNKKLKPGIYSIEDNHGNLNYYAYGLISINTKKPLYKKDEMVEFIFVVLDKDGYLYDNANITLNVLRPNEYVEILSVKSRSIISSNTKGIYLAYLNATNIGEYKLFAYTTVDGINIEINSYFNVVEDYDFDIIRDVPVTIDPWQGPFLNNFSIIPKDNNDINKNNNLIYDFYEYIPNTFDLYETNADRIFQEGSKFVLEWKNLQGSTNPFYIANSPLITPYLYELGNAKIISDNYIFNENRSWLFAIDPLILESSTITCSQVWGFNCGQVPDQDNTFDNCPNSAGTRAYVIEATLSANQSFGGEVVDITCNFKPRNFRTEEYIYYYNGLSWTQLYSGNAPGNTAHEVTVSHTLSTNSGTHWFRCITDQDGENDECANSGSDFDNDDVSIQVLNSFLTLISPEPKDYLSNLILTNISTSVNADISYRLNSKELINACTNCQSFTNWDLYPMGTHEIEVIAVDLATGQENIWVEIFNVLSDNPNPPRDTTMRTCSDTFGFFCGDWPSTSEGDNTFDSCPSSIGGSADEHVIEVYINSSTAYTNDAVEVTCEFKPYSSGTEEYIYYYDGLAWTQLYSGNPIDGNIHNVTVSTILSDNPGTHWFRCIVDWDGENDECANVGSYYDNDDASIEVVRYIENLPFLLNINSPLNITYNSNIVDFSFSTTKNATIKYKLDSNPFVTACTNCDNFDTTQLFHNGSHSLIVEAIDDITSEIINKTVTFFVSINNTNSPRNTSMRTCSDTFGFFCGIWPSTSEGDNTFDSCPSSIGADEHVIEVYVNSSSVYVNDTVEVTCEFSPYSIDNEDYIYYYDTNSWTQLYAGNSPGSEIYNVTVSTQISDYEGTHYFRCIIDWDGENDECANVGSYYDNDDASIQVIKPVIIPFIVSISSPISSTYNYTNIELDFISTKNSDLSYSINGASFIDACFNCTSFYSNYNFNIGYNNLTLKGVDVETLEENFDFLEFIIELPESNVTNNNLNLKIEKDIKRLNNNFYNININLSNLNNNLTPQNKNFIVYSFLPNSYNLTSQFTYSNSLWYQTTSSFETISDSLYNGTIYKFNITPINPTNSVFDSFLGLSNNNNSWNVNFNITSINSNFFADLFLTGFN